MGTESRQVLTDVVRPSDEAAVALTNGSSLLAGPGDRPPDRRGGAGWPVPAVPRSLVICAHDLSAALASLGLALLLRQNGQAIWADLRAPRRRRSAVPRSGRSFVPRLRSAPAHLELHLGRRARRDRQGVDLGGRPVPRRRLGGRPDDRGAAGAVGDPVADPGRAPLRHKARLSVRQDQGQARPRGCRAHAGPRATCRCCCTAAARWPPCSSARSSRRRAAACGWSASSRMRAPRAGATCTTSRSSASPGSSIGSSPISRSRAFIRNAS